MHPVRQEWSCCAQNHSSLSSNDCMALIVIYQVGKAHGVGGSVALAGAEERHKIQGLWPSEEMDGVKTAESW